MGFEPGNLSPKYAYGWQGCVLPGLDKYWLFSSSLECCMIITHIMNVSPFVNVSHSTSDSHFVGGVSYLLHGGSKPITCCFLVFLCSHILQLTSFKIPFTESKYVFVTCLISTIMTVKKSNKGFQNICVIA